MKYMLVVLLAVVSVCAAQVGNIAAAWEQLPLHVKIQGCLEGSSSKTEAAKCVAANLGHDIVAAKDKVEELLKTGSQDVKDFFHTQGQKVKDIIANNQILSQIGDKAKELKEQAKNWFDEHFGQKTKRQVGNIAAAWEQMPLHVKIQLCVQGSSSKTEAAKCVAANLGNDIVAAKDKVASLLQTASQDVKDFLQTEGQKIKDLIANKQEIIDAVSAKAQEAKKWLEEHLGRKKRQAGEVAWYPSPEEVQVARKVQSCMEKTGLSLEKCLVTILGLNADKADPLRVQTIIRYEAVLAELKEWFSDAEKKGLTMQQYLAYRKAQKEAARGKRQAGEVAWYPSPEEVQVARKVQSCMEKTSLSLEKCLVTILGLNADKTDPMRVQTIIRYEAVLAELKEWFTDANTKGMTMQQYLAYRKAQKEAAKAAAGA